MDIITNYLTDKEFHKTHCSEPKTYTLYYKLTRRV